MSEPLIRPDVRNFLAGLKASPRPGMTTENLPTMRPLAPAGMAMLEPPIGDLACITDFLMPGPDGLLPLRMFDARAKREAGPVVVFFHGGGYVIGCIDTHAAMCAEIARQLDLPVISVEYRLAPENPWPSAPDDAEAAARWISENGEAFGLKFTGLVLCGDSAGGNLTIVTALALRDRPAALPVLLQFAIYPATDPEGDYDSGEEFAVGYGLDRSDMNFYNRCYSSERGHWRASPLVADQTGMPPTLILTASLDPLRDQGRAYAAKTKAAGVPTTYLEAKGTIHGFVGFRRAIPSGQKDFIEALEVARKIIAEQEISTLCADLTQLHLTPAIFANFYRLLCRRRVFPEGRLCQRLLYIGGIYRSRLVSQVGGISRRTDRENNAQIASLSRNIADFLETDLSSNAELSSRSEMPPIPNDSALSRVKWIGQVALSIERLADRLSGGDPTVAISDSKIAAMSDLAGLIRATNNGHRPLVYGLHNYKPALTWNGRLDNVLKIIADAAEQSGSMWLKKRGPEPASARAILTQELYDVVLEARGEPLAILLHDGAAYSGQPQNADSEFVLEFVKWVHETVPEKLRQHNPAAFWAPSILDAVKECCEAPGARVKKLPA